MCSGNQEQSYVCPDCNGDKIVKGVRCERCEGTGVVQDIGYDTIAEVATMKKAS
jgi:DnaJ-class molecular chaperone